MILRTFPAAVALVFCATLLRAADTVHLTYHWHLHQPIYWPERAPTLERYQFAWDSLQLKLGNTGNFYPGSTFKHPRNALVSGDGGEFDSVFDKADRVKVYQGGGRDSIQRLLGLPDAGASVSYETTIRTRRNSRGITVTLTWACVPGKKYLIEYTGALTAAWQPLTAQQTAPAGAASMSFQDLAAAGRASRFYRVKLVP